MITVHNARSYILQWSTQTEVCVCSNANPLHYYAVPRKVDRWHSVWSIFESCTTWADHITCVWDEYLYSVLYEVEVRVTVCVTLCVVCDDDERKGEGETRCRLIACSSRKAPRGPPGLTSPSGGRIAINSTICLLKIRTSVGFGILSRTVLYIRAIS